MASGTRVAPGQLLLTLVGRVADLAEAARWIEAGADVIQLEKCEPEVVALAGGVNGRNAEAYAATGARVLVSSATCNALPRDVAVGLGPL